MTADKVIEAQEIRCVPKDVVLKTSLDEANVLRALSPASSVSLGRTITLRSISRPTTEALPSVRRLEARGGRPRSSADRRQDAASSRIITSPAYVVIKAANEFKEKTTAINQLWQTDFTYRAPRPTVGEAYDWNAKEKGGLRKK